MFPALTFILVALKVSISEILAASLPENKMYEDNYFYSKYNGSFVTEMMMPDDNGLVVSAIISGISPQEKLKPDNIIFHLWTRKNVNNPEVAAYQKRGVGHLNFTKINPKRPTVFLIHGFTDSIKEPEFFDTLVPAFLKRKDCNVIGVNWTNLASVPWYGQAVKNTFFVGLVTAQAISEVRKLSPEKSKIHIVAHNIGTLVAGVAAYAFGNEKIDRITGLDPAFINTRDLPQRKKLTKNHAKVVEVIHTSGNYLGVEEPIGHRDFYPNGGVWPQPGCLYDVADRCSPRRAYQYYAEALTVPGIFLATKCPTYEDYLNHNCDSKSKIHLVNNASAKLTGKFYFVTNSEPPFSKV